MSDEQMHYGSKAPLILGWFSLALVIGGIVFWATQMTISGALVLSGVVEVEGNRQIVQHPEGGVIAEIFVEEGDAVEAGEILLRFESEAIRSDLSVVTMQLSEIMAHKARLIAERDGSATVEFDQLSIETAGSHSLEKTLAGQINLFLARRDTLEKEEDLLNQRIAQILTQIAGLKAQLEAMTRQLVLMSEELANEKALMSKGLSQAVIVRDIQREIARLDGSIAELNATIAERKSRIVGIEIEILKLRTLRRKEAITTLHNIQFSEIEMRAEQESLQEVLGRLNIRAPTSGVVYNMQFHNLGAVVRKAEPIMYIIPQDRQLVIKSKIPATQISQVHLGQLVSLRFSYVVLPTSLLIEGVVSKISPDIFADEATGDSYYSATITIEIPETHDFEAPRFLPGMPVELLLETTGKVPIEMLFASSSIYENLFVR